MRKVWISKDQLIPKPFYRKKLFFFIVVLIFSIIFIIYQFIFINKLATNNRIELFEVSKKHDGYKSHKLVDVKPLQPAALDHKKIPLGIRIRDLEHYQTRYPNQLFKCLNSPQEISFDKVNDDYCDCLDETDETSTNACSNGRFYCTKQLRHKTGRGQDVYVPTSRINDKICDCTDCSDEFT